MNPLARQFRALAATAKLPPREVSDFIDHVIDAQDDARLIAAHALEFFCMDDGLYNRKAAAVLLVVRFLNITLPPALPPDHRSMKDLRNLLDAGADADLFLEWCRANYR